MNIEHLRENGIDIAVVSGDETVVVDVQSALDLAMTVKYETGAERIVIDKAVICGDFFILHHDGPQHGHGWRDSPEIHELSCEGGGFRGLFPLYQKGISPEELFFCVFLDGPGPGTGRAGA